MDGYSGGATDTKEWKAFADSKLVSLDPVKRGSLIIELAGRTNRTGIMPTWVGKEQP